MSNTIRILSIDGGGTRGVFPATILENMKREFGRDPREMFQVIVGSATGGIIAAALAAGMDTKDIIDIYLKEAKTILPISFWRRIWNPMNLFAPKYPNDNLKSLLKEKFGSRTLGQVRAENGSSTVYLFPCLNMSPCLKKGETPEFKVEIFNTCHSKFDDDSLVDVAMRTSAAAVNLPLYEAYAEGGNFANDPALVGFFFGISKKPFSENGQTNSGNHLQGLGANIDQIKILSLGCGSTGRSFIPLNKIKKGNWGLLKWSGNLISLVIETKMVATQHYLRQLLDEQQYLRINAYYKAADAPKVLRDKKLAIDVREEEQLRAIHEYANTIFEKEKGRIGAFISR